MRPQGLIGWLQIWWAMVVQSGVLRRTEFGRKLASDNTKRVRALSYVQSKEVTFRVTSGPQEFEVDGEAVGEVVAGRIVVEPDALWVKIPDPDAAVTPIARAAKAIGQEMGDRFDKVVAQAQAIGNTPVMRPPWGPATDDAAPEGAAAGDAATQGAAAEGAAPEDAATDDAATNER